MEASLWHSGWTISTPQLTSNTASSCRNQHVTRRQSVEQSHTKGQELYTYFIARMHKNIIAHRAIILDAGVGHVLHNSIPDAYADTASTKHHPVSMYTKKPLASNGLHSPSPSRIAAAAAAAAAAVAVSAYLQARMNVTEAILACYLGQARRAGTQLLVHALP
jgi:hypothetical protein